MSAPGTPPDGTVDGTVDGRVDASRHGPVGTLAERRDLRRRELLERVADHVLAVGMGGASLRSVAAATGSNNRMLLYYFGSREAMLAAAYPVAVARFPGVRSALGRLRDTSVPLEERLLAAWTMLGDPENRPVIRLFFEVLGRLEYEPTEVGSAVLVRADRWVEAATDAFEAEGLPRDDAATLGLAVVSGWRGLLVTLLAGGDARRADMSAHSLARSVAELVGSWGPTTTASDVNWITYALRSGATYEPTGSMDPGADAPSGPPDPGGTSAPSAARVGATGAAGNRSSSVAATPVVAGALRRGHVLAEGPADAAPRRDHVDGGRVRTTWSSPHATLVELLLRAGECSGWGAAAAEEVWLWQGPTPVALQAGGTGSSPQPGDVRVLGDDAAAGQVTQAVVPAGAWRRTLPAQGDVRVTRLVAAAADARVEDPPA